MSFLYNRLQKYACFVRVYSIVDVILLFLLARMLAVGDIAYQFRDVFFGLNTLFLWFVLTLFLEASHKHSYRESIGYTVPVIFLLFSSVTAFIVNYQAFIFVCFVFLFTLLYVNKDKNSFFAKISIVSRGLWQLSLFFFCLNLYTRTNNLSWAEVSIGVVIALFHAGRNLIADIRDVAFDSQSLVVFWGSKRCYIITLLLFFIGSVILVLLFSNMLVSLPALAISLILLFYDDGLALHRCAIMTTSFTFVTIMLHLKGTSLLYPNLLFLGVLANFLFYEKIARPSNSIARVPSQARFLFKG